MADTARARKVADRIKVVVAETLERRVKDPRLGFITVTDTRVTGDLQHATVFYTVFGDEDEKAATAAALESAKGKLRSEVGKAIGIRLTPSLEFVADAMPETAESMAELLRIAAQKDAEVAALAVGKQYAGDEDPYRHPEVEDVDLDDDSDEDGSDEDGSDEDGSDEDGSDEDGSDEDGSEEDSTDADGSAGAAARRDA